jgi:hypothetical protein
MTEPMCQKLFDIVREALRAGGHAFVLCVWRYEPTGFSTAIHMPTVEGEIDESFGDAFILGALHAIGRADGGDDDFRRRREDGLYRLSDTLRSLDWEYEPGTSFAVFARGLLHDEHGNPTTVAGMHYRFAPGVSASHQHLDLIRDISVEWNNMRHGSQLVRARSQLVWARGGS